MAATEKNLSYNDHIQLKRYPKPPEVTYQKFMLVLTDYNFLSLTVWVEQCNS